MAKREQPKELTRMPAPLEHIEWKDPFTLNANDYNPNVVMTKEMDLLRLSIEKNGWIQPILVSPEGIIIDGFHRVTISRLQGWAVPCAVLVMTEAERMMLTIRINRAKGTHVALRMSTIVKKLKELGVSDDGIAEGIGASKDEVTLLQQSDIFTALNIEKWRFSKAWMPRGYHSRHRAARAADHRAAAQTKPRT